MMDIKALEKTLGICISNKKLFVEALTHKSFANEHQQSSHNERLEFLGDAVLELVITDFLFQTFPKEPEGKMTKLRSALVKTESLAEAMRSLGLGKMIKMSRGEAANRGSEKAPTLANVFEAIVGALYLDGGFSAAQDLIARMLFPRLSEILEKNLHLDPKSAFQEFTQEKWETTPTYCTLSESGPDHEKVFCAGVFVGKEEKGRGEGTSKQKAEIAAAKNALENLEKEKGGK